MAQADERPVLARAASFVKRKLFAGFLALFPLAVTVWTVRTLLRFLDGFLAYQVGRVSTAHIPGLGILALFLLLLLTGTLVTSLLGRKLFGLYDSLLRRIPFARMVYVGAKQFVEAFSPEGRKSFQKVVLVEFPRKGIYAVGFVTKESVGEVQARTPERVSNVFVPHTPNPMTGSLLLVPNDQLIPLSMTIQEGVKLIVSAGLVSPTVEGGVRPPAGAALEAGAASDGE